MRAERLSTSKGSFLYILRGLQKTHLRPSLPFQITHGNYGVEVISKTDNLKQLTETLRGTARLVPEQIAQPRPNHPRRIIDDLFENDFESSIDVVGHRAVLWGPISLANHDCQSEWEFEVVGDDEAVQGRDYFVQAKVVEDMTVANGQTVTMFYAPCQGETDFVCNSCSG